MQKPRSYDGKKPFLFISYSHKDSEIVFPMIDRMNTDGCRVWYDNGIEAGTAWDENIANHVGHCSMFIAMISENYLASDNCKDELNFARDRNCSIVMVYLQSCTLPEGMQMRLNRLQSLNWFDYEKKSEFFTALYAEEGMEKVQTTPEGGQPADKRVEKKAESRFRKNEIYGARRYFPPGFRRGKPLNMIVGGAIYLLIIYCSATLYFAEVGDTSLFCRVGTAVMGFAMALVAGNYLGIQNVWNIGSIRSPKLRMFVRILITVMLEVFIFFAGAAIFWVDWSTT